MIAAYRAYRLSATKALRGEAETSLPEAMVDALDRCHQHRREGKNLAAEVSLFLTEESEQLADAAVDHDGLGEAWAVVEATGLKRAARRLLGPKALARHRTRDERKGWPRIDGELRRDAALPAAFRANPAQHFYAMHRALAERRRQQWRELCDLDENAVALAA